MKKFYFFFILQLYVCDSSAQIKLGSNVHTIHPYALLELESSTQGLLMVRMDTNTRDAAFKVLSPPEGLLIYNTDTHTLEVFTNRENELGSWTSLQLPTELYNEKFAELESGIYDLNLQSDFLSDEIQQNKLVLVGLTDDLLIITTSSVLQEQNQSDFSESLSNLNLQLDQLSLELTLQTQLLSNTMEAFELYITKNSSNTILPVAPEGSILVRNNNSWVPMTIGLENQVLQVTSSNTLSWKYNAPLFNVSSTSSNYLSDNDLDTQISVETTADDDNIRFNTRGIERALISSNGSIGIGTSSPNSSSVLEIQSDSKGFLLPRITKAKLSSLTASATSGLLVYCTDCSPSGFYGFNDDEFINLKEGASFIPPTTTGTITSLTGRIWMDRNLGALQRASTFDDDLSFGNYYQWGRGVDGHEFNSSTTTSTLSNTIIPGHGLFIKTSSSPNNWLDYLEDTLWQTEDPCPDGFRVPTETEWKAERDSWSSNDAAGAFESPLKLPLGGYRHRQTGKLTDPGTSGRYWSSTTKDSNVRRLALSLTSGSVASISRSYGYCIRCIAE